MSLFSRACALHGDKAFNFNLVKYTPNDGYDPSALPQDLNTMGEAEAGEA